MTQTVSQLQRTKLNEELAKARNNLFRVPDRRPVSVWAEDNIRLASADSATSGPLRFTDFNYQRAPLDSINEPGVERIIIKAASQTLKTQTILVYLAWLILNAPGPVLIVEPIESTAAGVRTRIKNLIDANPELKRRFIGKSYKTFIGGEVNVVTAGSPSALAMRSIKYLFIDETDRKTDNREGSIIGQAEARTTMYSQHGRKIIIVSSPGLDHDSIIADEYEESSKGVYMVPCHNCGHAQQLKFEQVQAPKRHNPTDGKSRDLERTFYECSNCQQPWDENEKNANVRNGYWTHSDSENKIRGFSINSINSIKKPLKEILSKWFKIIRSGNEGDKQAFVNTILNRTYKDITAEVSKIKFMDRIKPLPQHSIPNDIALITCGADVGVDGIWYVIKGYGPKDQGFTLESGTFYGSPTVNATWDQFRDELFNKVFTREDDQRLLIHSFAIDAGHEAESVVNFCSKYNRRRVYPIKGQAGMDRRYWPQRASKQGKFKGRIWMVGVDAAKKKLYQQLTVQDIEKVGYQHFSDSLDNEFFLELTGEELIREKGKERWHKRSALQRVEALDCVVYADCVRHAYGVNLEDRHDQLLAEGEALQLAKQKEQEEAESKEEPTKKIIPKRPRARSRPAPLWKQ